MGATDKQKQSLYFPEDTLQEIMRQATRLDRSLSWTVQQAWRLARENIRRFPSASQGAETERTPSLTPPPSRADAPRIAEDIERIRASSQVLEFLKGKFDHDVSR
jgi:uncharacterized small protein (TIGR04563 family)